MFRNILYNSMIYYLIFNFFYYISSAICFLFDYGNILFNLNIKKINTKRTNEDIINEYVKIYKRVLFNSFIGIIPFTVVQGFYDDFMKTNDGTVINILTELSVVYIFTDILFYFFHRILHIPKLYMLFHKKHHEIISPVGMSAIYMTIVDLYVGNIIPVYLPLYFVRASTLTTKIWLILTTVNTVFLAHSGFENLSDFHDKHHSLFNYNFGTNFFMDRLCGTYKN